MFWIIFAGVGLVLLYLARNYMKEQENYWPSRGFPNIATPNPLVMMWKRRSIREIDCGTYRKIKYELKQPFGGTQLLGMRQLIITDLDLAKRVLVKDAEYFLGRFEASSFTESDPLFYKMLVFMEGEAWKELRAKMSPTFTTGKIKKMFHVFETSSAKLVDYLGAESTKNAGQEVKVCGAYGRYTMDVIASAAFGLDAKTFAEEDPIFIKMGKKLQIDPTPRLIAVVVMMTLMPRIAAALKLRLSDMKMGDFFSKVILSTIEHRDSTGDRRDDFLQLMLDARNGQLKHDEEDKENLPPDAPPASIRSSSSVVTKPVLSDDVLIAQSVLFILAGYDTTQTLLIFTIYELALNPEIQDKLYAELATSWTNNNGKFTYETVNQLEYLDKVVNESLRKYPPAPRLERLAMQDYQIPDTDLVIPKGIQVVVQTYPIHQDEEYFPQPEKFDPERFTQENKASRHPYAFQAFGHGPRNCIGMRFALTNAKMAIATLVHSFKFEPSAKTLIPMQFENSNFIKPKGGLYLKLTKRENE